MIVSILDGYSGRIFAVWGIIFYSIVFIVIFLITLWLHFRNNWASRKMEKLSLVYADLVQAVKAGCIDDGEIKRSVLPADFRFFEMYLRNTISLLDELDVSAEKRIAEVSGFIPALHARIMRSRKWKRAFALRTLSYFRDPAQIPVFRKMINKERCREVILAAGAGLALCGDIDSLKSVMEKVALVSKSNEDILLLFFGVFGSGAASFACQALEEGSLAKKETYVAIDFLGLCRYAPAVNHLTRIVSSTNDAELLIHAVGSLQLIGDSSSCAAIVSCMRHENFMVRIRAALAIGVLGGMHYADELHKIMHDDNWWVARSAAEALAGGGEDGIQYLGAIAQSDEGRPAKIAKFVLAEAAFNRLKKT